MRLIILKAKKWYLEYKKNNTLVWQMYSVMPKEKRKINITMKMLNTGTIDTYYLLFYTK